MRAYTANKALGQHFLTDKNTAAKIVKCLSEKLNHHNVLELGPGQGALTELLLELEDVNLKVIDVDPRSIELIENQFPQLSKGLITADFLKYDISKVFDKPFGIIGNFPYNISSQILFKVLKHRNQVDLLVGMFQKEVAERITSNPGTKKYGILSVLCQAYYNLELMFSVNETVFVPPPKVKSAVIRLTRNTRESLECHEELFFTVVKQGFNQRRKTLRNSLKALIHDPRQAAHPLMAQRPEQLGVAEFIELTKLLE